MAPLLAVATTSEADALLTKYSLEPLAQLLGTLEVRTLLDVRALSNLQHGALKVAGPQRDVVKYCEQLKLLDDTQDPPLTAGDLASALTGLAGRTASEASKEITPSYETERLAKVFSVYALNLLEGEYGNRRALYLANKYMGPTSEHLYPTNEQMPYAALKAAGGGISKANDSFDARVDGDGRVCFTPADPVASSAKSSRQVSQQVKLKVMTLFLELCGESVPAGFSAGITGVMPCCANRSQVGIDEVWRFCNLIDQGARDVPVKEAWETIVECTEKNVRDLTKPPSSYTLGNALSHAIVPLTAAISHFKATFQAQKAASAPTKRGSATKRETDGDEGPAPSGQNGAYSRRQVAA
eukprot:CAMPEP_0182828522 /NCGR_PEP_ID=MMETSP0006_2-20121128/17523_1 /TAXON_ID=97485 /ORGANISM="Prymnesium parvum, Strain Texoma1" /LENGTH=354 /DNA_ID=CAMNT_0024955901 /DNA_START=39 /DNA_END=1099 /DNA_ORIENTATION=+